MGKIFGCRHQKGKTLNSVLLIKSEEEGGEELEKRAKSVKYILNLGLSHTNWNIHLQ